MGRFSWAVILAGLLLLASGGWWFWTRGNLDRDFENAPVAVSLESERDFDTDETELDSAAEPESIVTPLPEPMPATALAPAPAAPTSESSETLRKTPRLIAFGYRVPPAPRTIDTLVIHSSYNASGGDAFDIDKIIKQYEDYGVGAHYLVGRQGTVYILVEEGNIAYHAGVSKMPDGRKNVNDFSIGIELVGTEESGYTAKQYAVLNSLLADIRNRHTIKNVVGHADIAPGRKTDPWAFDWKKLR